MKDVIDQFVVDYTGSEDRASKGRGGRKIVDPALQASASDFLTNELPKDFFIECKEVMNNCVPTLLAVTKDTIAAYREPDALASIRFTLTGTRTIVMCRMDHLLEFMGKLDFKPENLCAARAVAFMKAMTLEQVQGFQKDFKFYHCTVGTKEAVYTPMGWACVEKISSNDVYGMCMRGVVKLDASAPSMVDAAARNLKDTEACCTYM
jgi:hypothetical protein